MRFNLSIMRKQLSHTNNTIHQITSYLLEFSKNIENEYAPLNPLLRALDGVQAFWLSGQSLSEMPEPQGDEARVLVLKAAIIERLVEVYNHPLHGGDQRVPFWCVDVPKLCPKDEIWLIRRDQIEWGLNPTLRRRGVMALENFLMFA